MQKNILFKTAEFKCGVIDGFQVENYYLLPADNTSFTEEEVEKIESSVAYKNHIIYRYNPDTEYNKVTVAKAILSMQNVFTKSFTPEEIKEIEKNLTPQDIEVFRQNVMALVKNRQGDFTQESTAPTNTQIDADVEKDPILQKLNQTAEKGIGEEPKPIPKVKLPAIDDLSKDDILDILRKKKIPFKKDDKKEVLYNILLEQTK